MTGGRSEVGFFASQPADDRAWHAFAGDRSSKSPHVFVAVSPYPESLAIWRAAADLKTASWMNVQRRVQPGRWQAQQNAEI
jgi:hypothetical protein